MNCISLLRHVEEDDMRRLKCWKKERIGKNRELYRNPSKHLAINISYAPRGIAETPYFIGISKHGKFTSTKYFKAKSKANSFANKYMGEHDSC